ncbi:hypothetical protein V7O66_05220 [Methanolobus sp. ZRKC3]|uniref:hypothetical protein n=1 Tax=Methanolobus sp. ZRKC3 TaxID=3125786 RepID=UPI00324AD90F
MMQTPIKLIWLVLAIICLCSLAGAAASSDDEIEWLDAEEYTLYWGDEVNSSGYLITAVDFSPSKLSDVDSDYAILSILTNRSESWSTILALNNSDISDHKNFEDRINISVVEIVTGNDIPAPYTTISVSISKDNSNIPVVKWIDATLSIEERQTTEIYMDERAHFDIKIKNLGNEALDSIEIIRDIPEDFVFDPDINIDWNFSLGAYDQRTYKYSLKALKPGTYNLSGMHIIVNSGGGTHSKTLNDSELLVHGPFINLTKSLSSGNVPLGDVVSVNITAINDGDRAAHVSITDELPQGGVLLDGGMSTSRVLHPENSLTLAYSMCMDREGAITVPSAKIRFIDSKEYEGLVYSKRSVINVGAAFMTSDLYQDGVYNESVAGEFENPDELEYGDYSEPGYVEDAVVEDGADDDEDYGMLQPVFNLIARIKEFFSGD